MQYTSNSDLPESVKDNVPEHAQTIYRKAYNNAHEQYKNSDDRRGDESLEETAARVAWSAVKTTYEKNDAGEWVET
jgi:cation transport regulator